jgi:hypothetical protein
MGQLGSEPTVRKAIAAVTLIYEKAEQGYSTEMLANDPKILLAYNTAAQSVQSLQPQTSMSTHIALISCVLFICLEFLRGDIRGSLSLARSGLKLIEDFRVEGEREGRSIVVGSDLFEELELIFCRLSLQSALFGKFSMESVHSPQETYRFASKLLDRVDVARNISFDSDANHADPALTHDQISPSNAASFSSVDQAKLELFLFLHDAHAFGVKSYESKYLMAITMEQRLEHIAIMNRFRMWQSAFQHFLEANLDCLSPEELTAAKVLRVYNHSSFIWVACSLEPYECAYDQYRDQFQTIVDLCDEIVAAYFVGEDINSRKIHVSNLSIIPPLHLTAWKCRFPSIRRKAIQILGSKHWREGMFDSHHSARCFEIATRLEESGIEADAGPCFDPSGVQSLTWDQDDELLPPEWARIHHVQFDFDQADDFFQKAVFYSKPLGPQGQWLREEVSIALSSTIELGASTML